jgi:hypothetical protein
MFTLIIKISSMFHWRLKEYMVSKQVPVAEEDLAAQFHYFRKLWGFYQKEVKSVRLGRVCTSPEHFTFFLFI